VRKRGKSYRSGKRDDIKRIEDTKIGREFVLWPIVEPSLVTHLILSQAAVSRFQFSSAALRPAITALPPPLPPCYPPTTSTGLGVRWPSKNNIYFCRKEAQIQVFKLIRSKLLMKMSGVIVVNDWILFSLFLVKRKFPVVRSIDFAMVNPHQSS
jgi:hypothetical protein